MLINCLKKGLIRMTRLGLSSAGLVLMLGALAYGQEMPTAPTNDSEMMEREETGASDLLEPKVEEMSDELEQQVQETPEKVEETATEEEMEENSVEANELPEAQSEYQPVVDEERMEKPEKEIIGQ